MSINTITPRMTGFTNEFAPDKCNSSNNIFNAVTDLKDRKRMYKMKKFSSDVYSKRKNDLQNQSGTTRFNQNSDEKS